MPDYTPEDVNDAFLRMLEARDAVVARLQMTDPADAGVPLGSRPLPTGVDDDRVRDLESHFQKIFPPSYKYFLRKHNGAPWADLGSHFFSAEEVLDFDIHEKNAFFRKNLARFKRESADDLIVFAASNDRNTTIVLDSGSVDEHGEWPVTYLSKRDKVLYTESDFVKYMLRAAKSLERLRSRYS